MTKEQYVESHIYVGKHEPKNYIVYRVLGPAGPEDYQFITGLDNVKEAIKGCWDWEVTRADTKKLVRI